MPAIARGNGVDSVNTGHPVCKSPGTIATLSGSGSVYVAGSPCHRQGDTNTPHTHCPPVYSTTVSSYSSKVYANGKGVARLNDSYTCGAFIQSVSQSTVFTS